MEEKIDKFLYDYERWLKKNGVYSFTQDVRDTIRELIDKKPASEILQILKDKSRVFK